MTASRTARNPLRYLIESIADGMEPVKDDTPGEILKVLCISGADFEDDHAEQRAWASREGADAVLDEVEKEWEKADGFKFPVYSNVKVPAGMDGWFRDPDLFDEHRKEIEEVALPQWNEMNGFRFVKAVSLEFADATDDVFG